MKCDPVQHNIVFVVIFCLFVCSDEDFDSFFQSELLVLWILLDSFNVSPQIPSPCPFFVRHVCLSIFSLCVSFPFMLCLLHFRSRLLSCKLLAVKFNVRTHTNSVNVLDSGLFLQF